MKFFHWMQSKLQGKKLNFQNKELHPFPSTQQQPEETSPPSLPLGLLAIGTFGNNNELRSVNSDVIENVAVDHRSPAEETKERSLEEVEEALREILRQKSQLAGGDREIDGFDYSNETDHEGAKKKIGLVIGAEWTSDVDKSTHKSIVKKSVSFLVKKMFVCGSTSFAPLPPSPPIFMDTPQDARMKKILRMMLLHKKIYPKNSSQTASLKRFIKEKDQMRDRRSEDKENNHDNCNVNSVSKPIPYVS